MSATSPRVRMYTTPWCPYCVAARRLLDSLDVSYEDVDVSNDHALRQEASAEHGWPTVPIVLLEGKLVGGYQELARLHRRGGLVETG